MVTVAIICQHAKFLQYYSLYSLCCTFCPMMDLLYNWKLLLPNPLCLFCLSIHTPNFPFDNHQLVIYLSVCFGWFIYLFTCFVFESAYVSEVFWYLSFSVWLASLIPSRSVHVVTMARFHFYDWVISFCVCMDTLHLLYPFTIEHLGCLHQLGNNATNKHTGARIFSN